MGTLSRLNDAARMAVRNGGGPVILDRFGNPIPIGGTVVYRPPIDLVFQVVDVVPIMDPRAPKGMAMLTMQVRLPINVPFGQPIGNMILVGVPEPVADQDDNKQPSQPVEDGEATSPGEPDRDLSQSAEPAWAGGGLVDAFGRPVN